MGVGYVGAFAVAVVLEGEGGVGEEMHGGLVAEVGWGLLSYSRGMGCNRGGDFARVKMSRCCLAV